MICPNCKNQLPDEAKFCKFCGCKIAEKNECNPPQNEMFNVRKKAGAINKKIVNKVITAFVIFVVVCIWIYVIYIVVYNVKRVKTETEELLVFKANVELNIKQKTEKQIVDMFLKDYDNDDSYEGYVVVCDTEDEIEDEEHPKFYNADIYFVTEEYLHPVLFDVDGKCNGMLTDNDKKYFSVEIYDSSGEHKSYIYTVKNGMFHECSFSGEYSNVHEDGSDIIAIDQNGNSIELKNIDE